MKAGTQNVAALYLGGEKIARVHLGGEVVFGAAPSSAVYTIAASVDPDGSGTVTGMGQYEEGRAVTLKAMPESGYNFISWRESGQTVSTAAEYTFAATGDRTLVGVFEAEASRLPDGYTEIEYVEMRSTGTPISYVDTGLNVALTGRYLLDVDFGVATRDNTFFYTGSKKSGNNTLNFSNGFGPAALSRQYGFATSATYFNTGETAGKHTVEIDLAGAAIKFDSQVTAIVALTAANITGLPLRLAAPRYTAMKWYSVKLYNGNATSRDLVPCKNPSGVAGFYDVVFGNFYTLTGTTGTIAAGPAV